MMIAGIGRRARGDNEIRCDGAHHVVRPEDWPVMPCAYTGFHLKRVGFFDGNPALDAPPASPPAACHHH